MSASNNISATEDTLNSLLSRKYGYVVPDYQRQYSWGEEQWQEFWDDLNAIEDGDSHFFGSFVFVEKDTNIDELDLLEVVDGQQRLTTVSILLCVIRQHYKKSGDDQAAEGLEDSYLWVEDADFHKHQKLELNSLDNSQYRRILNGDKPRQSESNLKEAVSYFSERINELSDEEVNRLRKRLLNSITLVTIECSNQESAFRLFETLNDRGLELSAVDLMKNYLYQQAAANTAVNSNAIREDWEEIIDRIRYEVDKPHRFFIHYMLFADEPDITETISQRTLYDRFKKVVSEEIPASSISLEKYISDMADATFLYLDIINAEIDLYGSAGNDRINQILSDLERLGFTQERTYLMGVFSNITSATEAARALRLIEAFIIRTRFTNSITGTKLNELYATLCSEGFDKHDSVGYLRSQLADQAPSDDELRAALTSHDFNTGQRAAFVLERIEEEHFRKGSNNRAVPSGEIEHIAPRQAYTATKYNTWPGYLGVGQDDFNNAKDRLGNLTLLEKRLNLEASDNPFDQKKSRYRGSDYKMANAVADYDDWSIDRINQRTSDLAEKAVDIWNFQV